MVSVVWLRLFCAMCALVLTWMCGARCASAQHDAHATVRTELANATAVRSLHSERSMTTRSRAFLIAAATTSAVLATSFVATEAFALRAERHAHDAARQDELARGMESLRRNPQASVEQARADILQRVSSVCLAGSVAATGTTLLIWLTGKRKERQSRSRTLLGPMVLRGANGGGLVLREKF